MANSTANSLEKQGTDEERNWRLEFTGTAEEHILRDKAGKITLIRQKVYGTLSIIRTNTDKSEEVVQEFEATSGWGGNGLIPDGEYTANKIIEDPNTFSDETGLRYKMVINNDQRLMGGRGGFLIHPTMKLKYSSGVEIKPNDGCISPIGHENSEPFLLRMKEYFASPKNKSIKVNVKIENNANVRRQLYGEKSYIRDDPRVR